MLGPNIVFAYHGCDESVARLVLDGGHLKPSQNAYDWLGHGIYFWEGSPKRGLHWAKQPAVARTGGVKMPAVIGAIIDLGNCLDLIDPDNVNAVKAAHAHYHEDCESLDVQPLRNRGSESKARFLDCAVIGVLHKLREAQSMQPFDTVRGFFVEGDPIYPTAGLRSLDHVQVCVRNPKCILGFFRPTAM